MKKLLTFIIVLSIAPMFIQAQSKKDIRNAGIKTEVTTKIISENGKDISLKDQITTYNSKGEKTSEIEYNREGEIKRERKWIFDETNKLIEESEFIRKDKTTVIKRYTYYSNGEKKTETEYDGKENFIKKHEYFYDEKNFKTERKTYDKKGNLLYTKTYQYLTD